MAESDNSPGHEELPFIMKRQGLAQARIRELVRWM